MMDTSDDDILQQIKTTCLADILNDDELSEVAQHCRPECYPAGHQLVQRDELMDRLFIIVKGCVRGMLGKGSRERIWGYINSGDVFGQYGLLSNEPSVSDIFCEFESRLLTIDRDDFAKLYAKIPALNHWLRRGFHRRFRSSMTEETLRRFARMVVFVCPEDLPEFSNVIHKVIAALASRGENIALITNRAYVDSFQRITLFSLEASNGVGALLDRLDTQHFDRIILELNPEDSATSASFLHVTDEVLWCFQADNPGVSLQLLGRCLDESESFAQKTKRICLLRPGKLQAPPSLTDPRLQKRDFIMPIKPSGGGHRLFEQGISRIIHHLCDVRVGISLAGGGAEVWSISVCCGPWTVLAFFLI